MHINSNQKRQIKAIVAFGYFPKKDDLKANCLLAVILLIIMVISCEV